MIALRVGYYISESTLNLINMGAYNVAITTWFVYACAKSADRENSTTLLKTQRWEQSLTDLQRPAAPDSLIPMFEGMVDRAFSRTTQYSQEVAANGDNHLLSTRSASLSELSLPEMTPLGLSRKTS